MQGLSGRERILHKDGDVRARTDHKQEVTRRTRAHLQEKRRHLTMLVPWPALRLDAGWYLGGVGAVWRGVCKGTTSHPQEEAE